MTTSHAILKKTAMEEVTSFKQGALLVVRLFFVFVAMLIAFVVSAVVIH